MTTRERTAMIYKLYVNKEGNKYYYVDWCRNEKSFKIILENHNDDEKDYKTHKLFMYEDNNNEECIIEPICMVNYTQLKEMKKILKKRREEINNMEGSLGEVHIKEDEEYEEVFKELKKKSNGQSYDIKKNHK